LLAEQDRTISVRCPEEIIAESTAYCRESGRLTWVVLDWLIRHIEQIDEQKLLQETKDRGDFSVLGVLCDAARLRKPHPKLEQIIAACAPHNEVETFFHRVAQSPLASQLTRELPTRWAHPRFAARKCADVAQADSLRHGLIFGGEGMGCLSPVELPV